MSKKGDDDVVMKDAAKGKDDKDKEKDAKPAEPVKPPTPEVKTLSPKEALLKDLRDNCRTLQDAVNKKDRRIIGRVTRTIDASRKKMRLDVLEAVAKEFYPEAQQTFALLGGKYTDPAEDVEMKDASASSSASSSSSSSTAPVATDSSKDKEKDSAVKESKGAVESSPSSKDSKDAAAAKPKEPEPIPLAAVVPETKVYIQLLASSFVFDKAPKEEGVKAIDTALKLLHTFNRRTLDLLSAKVYFLWSLAFERIGELASIRSDLLAAYRTACLQHNEPGQAALIIDLLRNYLHYNLFEQADNFRLKSKFPESRSNNQHARFLYYKGRIEAVKLQYSDAYASISEAIRKAPVKSAIGFRQKANKLLCIVQLLMGEIPERTLFKQADLAKSLQPYLRLTQAVRVGDLGSFSEVMSKYTDQFTRDGTQSLIVRLRHNVIKTGLRKINLSYSRISIKDICAKLNIASEEDAEYIVAKAIHDGVIDAVIDRKGRFLHSKENIDVYSTTEPQQAFDRRIDFCNKIHNEAVKALTFPPNAHKVKDDLDLGDLADEDLDTDSKEKPPLVDDEGH